MDEEQAVVGEEDPPAEAAPVEEAAQEPQPDAAPVAEAAQAEPEAAPAEEPAPAPAPEAPVADASSPLDMLLERIKALEGAAHINHSLDESAVEQIAARVLAHINASISKHLG